MFEGKWGKGLGRFAQGFGSRALLLEVTGLSRAPGSSQVRPRRACSAAASGSGWKKVARGPLVSGWSGEAMGMAAAYRFGGVGCWAAGGGCCALGRDCCALGTALCCVLLFFKTQLQKQK